MADVTLSDLYNCLVVVENRQLEDVLGILADLRVLKVLRKIQVQPELFELLNFKVCES